MRLQDDFPEIVDEPFINLDIMCVGMICSLKDTLIESDFSMCLANLLHYEEPEDPGSLIRCAIQVKKKLFMN